MNRRPDYRKNVYVGESIIHGKGIFTSARIPAGYKIMDIMGDVIDGYECERREEEENNVYIFWNGDDCYIDTARTKKIKYINHDCKYNCEVEENEKNGLMLVAARDIEKDEELTIDYGYEDIYDDCGCKSCISDNGKAHNQYGLNTIQN
ncbi:MAG: SET domain-containing protein [Ignavibacteria bacterium]|jgi:SET domain-containing protein